MSALKLLPVSLPNLDSMCQRLCSYDEFGVTGIGVVRADDALCRVVCTNNDVEKTFDQWRAGCIPGKPRSELGGRSAYRSSSLMPDWSETLPAVYHAKRMIITRPARASQPRWNFSTSRAARSAGLGRRRRFPGYTSGSIQGFETRQKTGVTMRKWRFQKHRVAENSICSDGSSLRRILVSHARL